jgi:ferredoxin-NADP reductase
MWRVARVRATVDETPTVRTLALEVPGWPGHRPGQHVDIRLTAEDGYQAQRSYSIATPADGDRFDVAVERLPDGEVSPYLNGGVAAGDELELRGPIGGHFVWQPADGGPVLLVAGGSGVVPLMAMVRARAAARSTVPMRLVYSARTAADVVYREELAGLDVAGDGFGLVTTLTRAVPERWDGRRGRVDAGLLARVGWPPPERPRSFVCGPTGFVEAVARMLVAAGHDPASVRTERFGPTGGE